MHRATCLVTLFLDLSELRLEFFDRSHVEHVDIVDE